MDSEPHIRNKLSQGKLATVFLVRCLGTTGVDISRL
ncbi:hypothetical protein [Sphingobium sp.]